MQTKTRLAIAGLMAVTALSAQAESKKEKAVEYREGVFAAMGWNFKPIVDMIKGKIDYNADELAMRAERVSQLASMPWEGFIEGTHNMRMTDAKEKIWSNMDDFRDLADKLERKTKALADATPADNPADIKKEVMAVGKTCESCHDEYKKD